MNRSIVTTAIGLLVVVATACADSTSAEPIDTAPVSVPSTPSPEPPQTDVPAPVTTVRSPVTTVAPPTPTLPPPVTTAAPPKPTVPTTTVPPPKPTVPPTTVAPPKPTVPPTTVAPTLPPPKPNGALCLVGNWTISDAELNAYFDVVAGNASFQSIDSTGVIRLAITETTIEWTNDYALSMRVGDLAYESTLFGSVYGAYSEANGVMTGMEIRDNRNSTITQDGKPVGDVGDLFVGINLGRPIDSISFSCNGPTLNLQAGPLAGARHTVGLTPA